MAGKSWAPEPSYSWFSFWIGAVFSISVVHAAPSTLTLRDRPDISVVMDIQPSSCTSVVPIKIQSARESDFLNDSKILAKVMAWAQVNVSSSCPDTNAIHLIGIVGGETIYQGIAERTNDWALSETGLEKSVPSNHAAATPNTVSPRIDATDPPETASDQPRLGEPYSFREEMAKRKRARARAGVEQHHAELPHEIQRTPRTVLPEPTPSSPSTVAPDQNINLKVWLETPRAQILLPAGDTWCGEAVTMVMLTPRKEDYENFGYRGMFGAESEVVSELERVCPQAKTIHFYGLFGKGPVFDKGAVYPFIASKAYNWQVSDWTEKRISRELPPTFTVVSHKPIQVEPNSLAKDKQLARELYTLVEDTETNINNITLDQFHNISEKKFMPQLRNLAASATAKYKQLPASGKDRTVSLKELDEDAGGAAMVLAWKWSRIPEKKSNAPITLNMMMQDRREMENWPHTGRVIVKPAVDIFKTYEQYFGNTRNYQFPPSAHIDPKFFDSNVQAKNKKTSARPASPTSEPAYSVTTTTYFGTPGMIAAAMVGSAIGKGVGEAMGAVAKAYATSVVDDAQIRNARNAFWQCHYEKCSQYKQVYMAYSEALLRKDLLYFRGNVAARNVQGMQNGFIRKIGSPGFGYVDSGIVNGCHKEFEAAANKLNAKFISVQKTGESTSLESGVAWFMETEAFQQWQKCRDVAEIIMRPRQNFF